MNSDEIDEKESCFGKVIKGQNVLDKIMDSRLRTLSMLGIKSIRVLTETSQD
jgi:cyclophilin family peptidyl-prolyl cis-trans isomerase